MDMSVHSWQICVKKMCISKEISYIRQMQRTYWKMVHAIYPNVTKVFPCFFLFFQITSDLLLTDTSRLDTLRYTDQPMDFIVISTDDLAPNRPQIRIWYGILTLINQLITIDLIMLAIIWHQQCILFIFYIQVLFLRYSTYPWRL